MEISLKISFSPQPDLHLLLADLFVMGILTGAKWYPTVVFNLHLSDV